jgi:hypothetical protein
MNSHLDSVLVTIINKGNRLAALLNAVDGHDGPAVGACLQDGDMVDGFPVPVVYRERIPLFRQARLDAPCLLPGAAPEVIPR